MLLRPRFVVLPVLLLAAGSAAAQVISPRPWTDFNSQLAAYTLGGQPVRDVEGSGDGSVQTGNSPDKIDIASGNSLANANCNPASGTGACGTSPSVYLGSWSNSTPTGDDDYLFFRLRVNGNPTASSGFDGYHWNVLLSTDADSYKEFWVDLDGKGAGVDELHIYYENNNSQTISSVATAEVATLDACNAAGATCGGSGRPSFTRAVSDPTTGEWFVDIQVPAILLDDSSGSGGNPNVAGSGYAAGTQVVLPSTTIGFLFSTGASSTDPLQKDYSAPCNSPPTGTCTFGDPATTPVTLSHVASKRGAAGVVVDFGTELEVGHGGFIVETLQGGQWKALDFVAAGDGVLPGQRRDYRVTLPAEAGSFRLVELDTQNGKRLHGPFQTGLRYGDATPPAFRPIDWKSAALEARAFNAAANRLNKTALLLSAKAVRPTVTQALIEIDVQQPGVVRVSGKELRALGVAVDAIDSQAYALTRGTVTMPLHTSRSGGTLADADYVEFVADFSPTLYSRTATYTLRNDRSRAERIYVNNAAVPAKGNKPEFHMATRSFERNLAYSFSAPVADPFYAARVLANGSAASYSTQLTLDRPYAAGGGGLLQVTLWGGSDFAADPDHHVLLGLNGRNIANHWFNGTDAAVLEAPLDAATLAAGVLNLDVQLPFDNGQIYDLVNYDKAQVTYPRQLYAERGALDFELDADIVAVKDTGSDDVSAYALDTGKVTRLRTESVCSRAASEGCSTSFAALRRGNVRYLIASASAALANRSLRTAAQDANLFAGPARLLIVAHAQFIDAAQTLADARRAEGWSVDVVDVAQVYRQFGLGAVDASAIRNYLVRAAADRATSHVLLFGGDSYDYHNNLGLQTISHLPSSYVGYDSISRYVPSDSDLADLNRDGVPDLAIGRLPARTQAEAQAMVAKILLHDTLSSSGRAVMVADRGGYAARTQSLALVMPRDIEVLALQVDDITNAAAVRTQLLGAIAAGVDVVNYHGHSAPTRWSFENILSTSHVAQVQATAPFIANQLGCWNNYYVDPRSDSLARAMLAAPAAAVAALGPTGLADEFSEEALAGLLLPMLHDEQLHLGDAILQAKRLLSTQPSTPAKDIQLGFNLLGDPSMRLH